MATPSEIITSRDRRRLPVSDHIHNVVDTTGGLTDELYNTEIMRTLGKTAPAYLDESEWDKEPIVPDLKSVLSKLGVKAEDDPTGVKAARKFVEEFPKKRDVWKKKVEKDPAFGTRGWETVYDLFKQTATDLMDYDIAENRRKIASGEDEKGLGYLQAQVANFMFPRAVKAVEEGRSPTSGEWARDVAANAAYAVPVSRILGGVTKAAPSIVKGGVQAAGQFAAPTAVAGMDYAFDPNYDSGDAATDITVGGLTNLGVNRILGPYLANKIGAVSGKVSRGRLPVKIRDVLEGSPSAQEKAAGLVKDSENLLKGEERALAAGLASDAAPASKASLEEARLIKEIAAAPDAPYITPDGKTVIDAATGKPLTGKDLVSIIEKKKGDEILAREAEDVLGSVTQQVTHPATAPRAGAAFGDAFTKGKKSYADVLRAHPEMKSVFRPEARFLSTDVDASRVLAPFMTYSVNMFGSGTDKAANLAGAALGTDAKEMKESNEKRRAEKAHKAAVSEILGGDNLTDEDYRYLEKLRDNPKMLKFSQDEGFKTWLLKRGHRLLQGTPAHRPLWEVE